MITEEPLDLPIVEELIDYISQLPIHTVYVKKNMYQSPHINNTAINVIYWKMNGFIRASYKGAHLFTITKDYSVSDMQYYAYHTGYKNVLERIKSKHELYRRLGR